MKLIYAWKKSTHEKFIFVLGDDSHNTKISRWSQIKLKLMLCQIHGHIDVIHLADASNRFNFITKLNAPQELNDFLC
jgi:hypothetical protein